MIVIKKEKIISTFESLLRLCVLLLQDTVSGDSKLFPVDEPYSKTIFQNGEDEILCVGEQLSQVLLDMWNKSYLLSTPPLISNTLKCLFMCSHKAKEVALEKGFVETLVEEMKDRLVKLKIESAVGKGQDKQVIFLKNTHSSKARPGLIIHIFR